MKRTVTPVFTFVLVLFGVLCSGTARAQHSVAHDWSEQLLEAIRNDFARPTVHARNLFHTSLVMYDAWAVYDDEAETVFLGKSFNGFNCPFTPIAMPPDIEAARREAISYAAFRLIRHRFAGSPGALATFNRLNMQMQTLGYDPLFTSTNYLNGSPAALGNYLAAQLIAYGLQDGSNEQGGYTNQYYQPVNPPLIVALPGNPNILDMNRWQPLTLSVFIDQSGNVFPGATPAFQSPEWGHVAPFALTPDNLTVYERDGDQYPVYFDPGPPPLLGTATNDDYVWNFTLVSTWSSHMSPDDGVMWDISPASIGNIPAEDLPENLAEYRTFYDLINGGDISQGHTLNPVTGQPYAPQVVPRGDYARVLAEFWADGPQSETPPGHWYTILNYVNEHPQLVKRFGGKGPVLDDLEWDVKTYLALGGGLHDAAVTCWGIKGWYDYVRPVSALRGMAQLGQSTDPGLPSYHPGGLPLIDGFVEFVGPGDPLAGFAGQHIGKIKIRAWRGPDYVTVPEIQEAGVGWILAENWWPFQRPTFVSPNFAGYMSGHSTFSRTAAEVLTFITGTEYFPGGMGEFEAPQNEFLVFEDGPSQDLTLQWATYRDASDQCSLSRIWGGIHPPADDIPGRLIGIQIGQQAFAAARDYFYKDEDQDGFYSYEDCDDTDNTVYPGAPELCDGKDNNCDGQTDEGVQLTFYADTDADGFGDAAASLLACTAPAGYVTNDQDCNDTDPNEYPSQTWWTDADADGFGTGATVVSCTRPASGYLATELTQTDGDCNDADPAISPAATEVCDGIDNNCDGQTDEGVQLTFYADTDGDGYGDAGNTLLACTLPTGYVINSLDCNDNDPNEYPGQIWWTDQDGDGYGTGASEQNCTRPATGYLATELAQTTGDCNDADPAISPAATEVCDGIDNNCDGQIDEGVQLTFYADTDGDSYGDAGNAILACTLPTGYVTNDLDCNDADPNEYPDQTWWTDQDGDGYGTGASVIDCARPTAGYLLEELTQTEGDCDDTNPGIRPNQPEIADNGIDEDCSGTDLFLVTKLFPNPFSDELTLHINYAGSVEVQFFNVQGQNVFSRQATLVDNQLVMDLSHLRSGVYILRLLLPDGKVLLTERVVRG